MTTNHIHRTITAALNTTNPLNYAALSGRILNDLQAGRIIRVSTHLQHLGYDEDFITSYSSPFGRHVARHYRTRTGRNPLRCWVAKENGRFIHVFVYEPNDFALTAALASYKRTATYAPAA